MPAFKLWLTKIALHRRQLAPDLQLAPINFNQMLTSN